MPGLFLSVKDSSLLLGFLRLRIFFTSVPPTLPPLLSQVAAVYQETNISLYPPRSFLWLQKAGPFLTDGGGRRLSTRCPQSARHSDLGDCPPLAESYSQLVLSARWWSTRLWPNFCAEVHRDQGVGFFVGGGFLAFKFVMVLGLAAGGATVGGYQWPLAAGSMLHGWAQALAQRWDGQLFPLLCLITWAQSSAGVFKDP